VIWVLLVGALFALGQQRLEGRAAERVRERPVYVPLERGPSYAAAAPAASGRVRKAVIHHRMVDSSGVGADTGR
jgi:hypothetical protein